MKYIGHLFFVVFIRSKEFRTWILLLLLFDYHHLIWSKHLSLSACVMPMLLNCLFYSQMFCLIEKQIFHQSPGFVCLWNMIQIFADATITHLLDLCLALWFVARIWSTGKLRFHMLFTSEKFVFGIKLSAHEMKYILFSDFFSLLFT